jgi:CheY-like chemotaxis protein
VQAPGAFHHLEAAAAPSFTAGFAEPKSNDGQFQWRPFVRRHGEDSGSCGTEHFACRGQHRESAAHLADTRKNGAYRAVANDGAAALVMLAQQAFDLVAMDMQMPMMDGLEATRKIRLKELGTARHMPIVAITANAFDDDRRKCFEAGMDGYVVKPVSAKAIGDEVSRVMALFNQVQPESVQK